METNGKFTFATGKVVIGETEYTSPALTDVVVNSFWATANGNLAIFTNLVGQVAKANKANSAIARTENESKANEKLAGLDYAPYLAVQTECQNAAKSEMDKYGIVSYITLKPADGTTVKRVAGVLPVNDGVVNVAPFLGLVSQDGKPTWGIAPRDGKTMVVRFDSSALYDAMAPATKARDDVAGKGLEIVKALGFDGVRWDDNGKLVVKTKATMGEGGTGVKQDLGGARGATGTAKQSGDKLSVDGVIYDTSKAFCESATFAASGLKVPQANNKPNWSDGVRSYSNWAKKNGKPAPKWVAA